ncbi:Protein Uncharacterized protein [Gossypium arboreum]|uniref:Protein Uncharacterized protein n=1 Tax=Gossypium arboreum TaxID=29729 RepID=A0A0B0PIY0_GOSAR|nr:Protein Uncharacterized protein [Gossypium arboreum]
MFEEKGWSCSFPEELVGLNLVFACFDVLIAILAFTQKNTAGLSCRNFDILQDYIAFKFYPSDISEFNIHRHHA